MRIATVGDNCIDVYENLGEAFPGGNPVNVAVYLVRLGEQASYTGVVGNDKYGDVMIDSLNNKGVDTSHIKKVHGNTAITKVELVNGERVFGDYDEGVLAHFKLTQDDIDFLSTHDLVVTGLWGKIESDLWKIKANKVPIAFDFATKFDDPVVNIAISNVDYAFFAYDEEESESLRSFMKEMHSKGPKMVVITLGEKGSICYDGKDFHRYGIVNCNVVDTMGAGDSYIAGFLRGIIMGKKIDECMRLGAENSSVTLQYKGAW
ncbi:fructoselysine 6-kinase [Clostridium sp. C8]|jgi:fructoselysine 6-kinase|uniref:fructoselysine 6-kinase n=1 Tax=Clostridium sp. C8 TaxID=1667357 RepID=UPI00062E675D|nr:fructoselysine 6-kinase [Clostridium sp. C8]KLE14510.1 fructoselysine kinase [Clostridium sp. C8]